MESVSCSPHFGGHPQLKHLKQTKDLQVMSIHVKTIDDLQTAMGHKEKPTETAGFGNILSFYQLGFWGVPGIFDP